MNPGDSESQNVGTQNRMEVERSDSVAAAYTIDPEIFRIKYISPFNFSQRSIFIIQATAEN